jgi:hypothetical protein
MIGARFGPVSVCAASIDGAAERRPAIPGRYDKGPATNVQLIGPGFDVSLDA